MDKDLKYMQEKILIQLKLIFYASCNCLARLKHINKPEVDDDIIIER